MAHQFSGKTREFQSLEVRPTRTWATQYAKINRQKWFENHNSKFCCDECYKTYIKENGLLNKENRKKSNNWINKLNSDGRHINKRVSDESLDYYISIGWVRGRILD